MEVGKLVGWVDLVCHLDELRGGANGSSWNYAAVRLDVGCFDDDNIQAIVGSILGIEALVWSKSLVCHLQNTISYVDQINREH